MADMAHFDSRGSTDLKDFAKYIAEHEDEPVDPLLIEARELAAQAYNEFAELNRSLALLGDDYLSGKYDDRKIVPMFLAALKSREVKS